MIYATRRERIEAEKLQLRGRRMRSMKVGVASFATFAGVSVAGIAPAQAANHTVESGDTLSGIAAQYDGVTVSSLMESNGLSSHLIYPGQNLSYSDGSSETAETASTSSGSHTVASGDTLGAIASQHGVSVSALMEENGLSSTLIYPGDQLTIPGSGSGSSSSSNSSAPAPSTGSSNSSSSSNSSNSSNSSSDATTVDASNSERVSQTSTASSSSSSSSSSGAAWAANMANSGQATYSFGANGAGNAYDCSSFSQAALAQDGKSIPRSSAAQYASSQKISQSQLQAGDLVFYGSGSVTHVAVYVGGGQIAHARNPSAGVTTNDMASYNQYNNVIGFGRY